MATLMNLLGTRSWKSLKQKIKLNKYGPDLSGPFCIQKGDLNYENKLWMEII